jgi:hypothetical protein
MFTTASTPCSVSLPFFLDTSLIKVLVADVGVYITIGCSLSSPFFLFKLLEVALALVEGLIPLYGGELMVSTNNIDAEKK